MTRAAARGRRSGARAAGGVKFREVAPPARRKAAGGCYSGSRSFAPVRARREGGAGATMYGMINGAMEEMVRMHHGDEAWARIRARAGIDVEVFMSTEAYPDDVTYRLVAAASDELGASRGDVLCAFGEHWITYTASEGYGGLLAANGATLPEFLAELPNFHARVAMIFPALQPPRFACSDVADASLRLHYWTKRRGLAPFVVGLVRGLGRRFSTEVEVRLVESRDAGADHDVFDVRWAPGAAATGAA